MAAHEILLADDFNFPLLSLFWTMFWLFLWVLWLFLLIRVISDIFRSGDLGGVGKAIWLLFVIALPYLGVLMYLILRGNKLHEREARQAQASEEAFRQYVQSAAGPVSVADELTKLSALRQSGALTEQEYTGQKAKLLG